MKQLRVFLVDDNDIDLTVNNKLIQLAEITRDIVVFSSATAFLNKIKDSDEDVWKTFDDINSRIDASTNKLNKYNSKFKDIDFSDLN